MALLQLQELKSTLFETTDRHFLVSLQAPRLPSDEWLATSWRRPRVDLRLAIAIGDAFAESRDAAVSLATERCQQVAFLVADGVIR
jgi:hypothetical protein